MPMTTWSTSKNGRRTWLGDTIKSVFVTSFCMKTTFAKIKIVALFTFEPRTGDRTQTTSVTGYSGMVTGNQLHFTNQTRPITEIHKSEKKKINHKRRLALKLKYFIPMHGKIYGEVATI